jgi:hypothetical protein
MRRIASSRPSLALGVAMALSAVAALILGSSHAATAAEPFPCKHGCDVALGTYKGHNDQGKAVLIHVAVGIFSSGPYKEAHHVIDHFKTEFVFDCGSTKANHYVDITRWGHINGVHGHLRYGETSYFIVWAPGEPVVGHVEVKSRECHGTTKFTAHRVGP